MNDDLVAVSQGEYSDYRVEFLAQRDVAEAFVERMNSSIGTRYGEYRIEEFDVLTEMPEIRDQLSSRVTIYEDGHTDQTDHVTPYYNAKWDYFYTRVSPNQAYISSTDRPWVIEVFVDGYDHDRVNKRLSELVAEAKANWQILVEAERLRRTEASLEYKRRMAGQR
jgi:hypothetical protein